METDKFKFPIYWYFVYFRIMQVKQPFMEYIPSEVKDNQMPYTYAIQEYRNDF